MALPLTMVLLWCNHGITMVIPLVTMVTPWYYHGVTMVLSWCYHGVTMALPLIMVLPWYYHGITMALPWYYHGNLVTNGIM